MLGLEVSTVLNLSSTNRTIEMEEEWQDLGSIGPILDNGEDPPPLDAPLVLFEELWGCLKDNPYYLFTDGLVPDFKITFEGWTEKELCTSDKLGSVLQFDETRPRRKREISRLEYCATSEQVVINFFLDAFVHIEAGRRGWARWATVCVRGAQKFAQRCVGQGFPSDYLKGVAYLVRWTMLHICLKKGKVPPTEEFYDGLAEFEDLPDNAKALVLAPKAFLLVSFRDSSYSAEKQGQQLMMKMVQLDPASFMWPYSLGNILHHLRRRKHDAKMVGPCADEISLVTKAYKAGCSLFRPDALPGAMMMNNARNIGMAVVCRMIAEILKAWDHTKQANFSVRIGEVVFTHESEQEDMVQFVLDNLKKLNSEADPSLYPVLVRSAEILYNILPFQYRDYDTAKNYLMKALELKPKKSKVHHKLGVLYIMKTKHQDVDKALDFFRSAVDLGPRNIPAALNLIQLLLCQPRLHKKEAEELIGRSLTHWLNEPVVEHRRTNRNAQLYFFHGCLKFMLGETRDAIPLWITAQSCSPEENFFAMVKRSSDRYHWNLHLLHYSKIHEALVEYMSEHSSPFEEGLTRLVRHFNTFMMNLKKFGSNKMKKDDDEALRNTKHSESEVDDDWRRPITNPSPPPVNENGVSKYIPPARRAISARLGYGSLSPPSTHHTTIATMRRPLFQTGGGSNENAGHRHSTSTVNQVTTSDKYIPPGRRNQTGHF